MLQSTILNFQWHKRAAIELAKIRNQPVDVEDPEVILVVTHAQAEYEQHLSACYEAEDHSQGSYLGIN